jgi:adenosylhomocysteine nucleosidase
MGIIGAMEDEITLLKGALTSISVSRWAGTEFYAGLLGGRSVVLARSRVGKVSAAICAQILVDRYSVRGIINTGCAGGLYEKLEMGDVVVSSELVQHDVDVSPAGNYTPGHIPGFSRVFIEADTYLAEAARAACEKVLKGHKAYVGRIASGDKFVADAAAKDWIWRTFRAYCVEMEGAAIAQACALNQVPFVAIRSISDKADKELTVFFDEFVKLAADNSCKVVLEMLRAV